MADPLFAEDRDSLVAQLRLSSADSADAQAAIDSAILAAVVSIYDHIGEALVVEIRSVPYSDNPNTSDARRRIKASVAEEKIVRAELLRKMPIMFRESQGTSFDRFNEEGLTSRFEEDRLGAEVEQLMADAVVLLDDLAGTGQDGEVSASVIGPLDSPVHRPGGTVSRFPVKEC